MTVTVHHADCLDAMRAMPAASVDAVVTDPPYHLTNNTGTRSPLPGQYTPIGKPKQSKGGFMGKAWDGGDIAFRAETWAEVTRVMKPGAHLVAFGGSKTSHRLACAIEDAGLEIRDTLMWMYGGGFPKSLDVAKAIDKAAGVEREVVGQVIYTDEDGNLGAVHRIVTALATDVAKQWGGWGTALKPAFEPIILARKPLAEATVAGNVLAHGTGALNVDACRVESGARPLVQSDRRLKHNTYSPGLGGSQAVGETNIGRWPPNVLHDGSPEVLAAFEGFGTSTSTDRPRNNGEFKSVAKGRDLPHATYGHVDSGTAARFFPSLGYTDDELRFFYSSKAGAEDRCGSSHPTVKPLALMRWLCRLITPPGGTVLDPFAGTGVTGEAAHKEGLSAVLIEREAEYVADIRRRIDLNTRQSTLWEIGA